MDDDTRMSDALDGYFVLAKELQNDWGKLASTVADKIDKGTYDGEEMLDAWVQTMRLTAQTALKMYSEALDAAEILSGSQYAPVEVDSDPFENPLPGATLALNGPLIGLRTREELVATLNLPWRENGKEFFTVHANATGYAGDVYLGSVLATRSDGSQSIKVFIRN